MNFQAFKRLLLLVGSFPVALHWSIILTELYFVDCYLLTEKLKTNFFSILYYKFLSFYSAISVEDGDERSNSNIIVVLWKNRFSAMILDSLDTNLSLVLALVLPPLNKIEAKNV